MFRNTVVPGVPIVVTPIGDGATSVVVRTDVPDVIDRPNFTDAIALSGRSVVNAKQNADQACNSWGATNGGANHRMANFIGAVSKRAAVDRILSFAS